jgi:hypothetical protein
MLDDPENSSLRAMTAEPTCTPVALSAGEVDLARDPVTHPTSFIGIHDFSDEFVTRSARESVVAALELKVCRADSGGEQTNARESLGHARQRRPSNLNAALFKMNGEHRNLQ